MLNEPFLPFKEKVLCSVLPFHHLKKEKAPTAAEKFRKWEVEMGGVVGAAAKVGDWAFKGFTAALGVATVYLGVTFSVNVYRGLSWHNSQSVLVGATLVSDFSGSWQTDLPQDMVS
ncbi:hypothetical protein AKJ16_DCAP06544 [Drosera capensis]